MVCGPMMGSGIDIVGNDDATDYVLNLFQNLKSICCNLKRMVVENKQSLRVYGGNKDVITCLVAGFSSKYFLAVTGLNKSLLIGEESCHKARWCKISRVKGA